MTKLSAESPFGRSVTPTVDVDALMDATRDLYECTASAVPQGDARVADLCLMRESDRNDFLDAEGLIAQLAGVFSFLPGVEAVKELGIEPLRTKATFVIVREADQSGQIVESKVHVEVRRVGRTRAVLFAYRGVHYLYSLASAATIDELGNQEWTTLLIRVVTQLRPTHVRTVNVSRYVRNQDVAGLLLHAFSRHVEKVWIGAMELSMRGERAAMDKLLFTMLATAAALERDWIVSRTLAGKVNKLRNGKWINGPKALPFGYVMDADKRLMVDPSQRDLVREVLLLVAERPTPKEFVQRLGALGVKMAALPSVGVAERSVRHSQNPVGKWHSVLSYVPLYATGEYVASLPNPFPGADEVAGAPITKDAQGREEIRVRLRPGLPEGGWAEPEVLRAALAVAHEESRDALTADASASAALAAGGEGLSIMEPRRSMNTKAPSALPWSGATWQTTDPHLTWMLAARTSARYTLVRWSEQGPSSGGAQ